jgi:hypothetical protein
MVNDRPKQGVFKKLASQLSFDCKTIWRQWQQVKKKLPILLNNQTEEDHNGIFAASSHSWFDSSHRKDEILYDRQELTEADEAGHVADPQTPCSSCGCPSNNPLLPSEGAQTFYLHIW